jgi:hypothetical protein
MDIFLDDKKFNLDYGFSFVEKISQLKKNSDIKLHISFYRYDNMVKKPSDLIFLQNIKEVPETIYISKSDYYWWVFDGCKLIDIKVYQDNNFYDYQGRNIEKWNCELKFSYNDVYGSNKKSVIDRDIKLKKLFNE